MRLIKDFVAFEKEAKKGWKQNNANECIIKGAATSGQSRNPLVSNVEIHQFDMPNNCLASPRTPSFHLKQGLLAVLPEILPLKIFRSDRPHP